MNTKKIILSLIICLSISCVLIGVSQVAASTAITNFQTGVNNATVKAGIATEDQVSQASLVARIGSVVGIMLYFAATILLVFIIWGGYMWMTAGGNEEKVKKGQKYIINSIIGYIVIAISYLIVQFVTGSLNPPA